MTSSSTQSGSPNSLKVNDATGGRLVALRSGNASRSAAMGDLFER